MGPVMTSVSVSRRTLELSRLIRALDILQQQSGCENLRITTSNVEWTDKASQGLVVREYIAGGTYSGSWERECFKLAVV